MTAITPRLARFQQVLTLLTPAMFRRMTNVVLPTFDPAAVPVEVQLRAYLYEWLLHLGFLSVDQVRQVIATLDHRFASLAEFLESGGRDNTRWYVTITDQRYATWTGSNDRWLDLETDRVVDQMLAEGVTHITCDIQALFRLKQRWLRRLEEGRDADSGKRARTDGLPQGAAGG